MILKLMYLVWEGQVKSIRGLKGIVYSHEIHYLRRPGAFRWVRYIILADD
jgi:hypothetical protein